MPCIHPTAIVDPQATVAPSAEIGPWCCVRGKVEIGDGCVLISHVNLQGPLRLGAGNICYPGVCLGFAPQDLGYSPHKEGAGLVVGDGNTFREGVTVHRGKTDQPTRIGDKNYFMASSHLGHDGAIGSNCVLGNGTLIGGHAVISDRVTFGGAAGVHQFVRIGRGAFMSGLTGVTLDVPPFFTITGTNFASTVNVIGLRRSGASHEMIDDVRFAYRTLCREGLTIANALEVLTTRSNHPMIAEYIEFIKTAKRGLCLAHGRRTFTGHGAAEG